MRPRLTLDGFSFSQQDVGKTISLEGSAKILVDGTMCNEVVKGLGIKLSQPRGLLWFRVQNGEDSLACSIE